MAARAQDQNLDSLLDTMANVVGILVVLVAVTQLSVGDAVDRITSRHGDEVMVSAEEVALAASRAAEVESAVVAAEGRLEAFAPSVARPGMLLDELRPHVDTLEALAGRLDVTGDAAGELADRIRQKQDEIEKLTGELEATQTRLSGLESMIGSVPAETRPKIARLPNPRTPPSGAKQIAILCRYGRCALLDLPGMRNELNLGIRDALGANRTPDFDEQPWLVNLFDKDRKGIGNYYWAFRRSGAAFFADIKWSDVGYGEMLTDLQREDSALVQGLSGLERDGRYLRFYVWSDSFEVYLEARYIAEQMGWDIGWLPIDEHEEAGINLLGGPRRRTLLD